MKLAYKSILPVLILGSVFTGCNAQVIFEENFNGDSLNLNNWSYEEGDGCPNLCGWGNNERQIYSRDYVKVEDGNLVIEANKIGDKYYSGKINTKDKIEFKYGEIEVRAKITNGNGLWPAIWMLGADIEEAGWPGSGEIDIMEYVGKEPHTIHTSLHTPASHGNTINTKKTVLENTESGFHVYKCIWTDKNIEFYIDGSLVYLFVPEKYDEVHYPYNKPFYLILNMAIGGDFGGPEVDDSIFPTKFYVDYIKVTELKNNPNLN